MIRVYKPPRNLREKLAKAVSDYGKFRRNDGSLEGEEIGYLAKDLAAEITLGQTMIMRKAWSNLFEAALEHADMCEELESYRKESAAYGVAS